MSQNRIEMNPNKECDIAVVVVQTKPKYHVIVPESYIFGLDDLQAQLKTWGVNNKCDHLIYWQRSFLDDSVVPKSDGNPNFNLVPRSDFPPPPEIDSACYLVRVKRFFSEYLFKVKNSTEHDIWVI